MTKPEKRGFTLISRACKGFTLIELLVVIAIIGILAALGLGVFTTARRSGRDSRRLGDIKNLQTALDEYYNDNSAYPTAATAVNSTQGTTWITGLSPTFTDKVQQDPQNLGTCNQYTYQSANGTTYTVTYVLEKTTANALGTTGTTPGGCATGSQLYTLTR